MQQKQQQNTRPSSGKSQLELQEQHKIKKFYVKESIYMLYYLFRISMGISILFFLTQNQISALTLTDDFQRMQENIMIWSKDVIIDIKTVNSYNCPEGYERYASHNWPGIKQGCFCQTSMGTWDYIKILQGACSQLAVDAGCTKIPAVKQIPYLFWKNTQLICLKRVNNLNFFTKIDDPSLVENCSIGQAYQFDSVSNLTISLCPITDIRNTLVYSQLISSINFSYARQTNYPVVDIKMTQYKFCNIYDKQNISPQKQGKTNYNLQLKTIEYCPKVDPRVVILDEISEKQLLNNNQRIFDVIQVLPAYPQPSSDYSYLLGFVRYPSWTYTCRQSQQFSLINVQSRLDLNQIQGQTNVFLIITFIFALICTIFWTLYYAYRKYGQLKAKHSSNLLYQNLKEIQRKRPNVYQYIRKQFSNELILFFVKLGLGIIFVSLLGSLYSNLSQYFTWFKQSQACTDSYMYSLIETYKIYFQNEKKNILLAIILMLTLMLVDTTIFCWRTTKDDLIGKESNQLFQNSDQHKSDDRSDQSGSGDIDQKQIQILQNSKHQNPHQVYHTEEQLVSDYQVPNQRIAQMRRNRNVSIGDMTDISELY